MKTSKSISRRNFIGKAAATAGLTTLGAPTLFGAPSSVLNELQGKLPREVWIATVSQHGLSTDTPEEMAQLILGILKKAEIYRSDIVCLPEVFMTYNVRKNMTLSEEADIHDKLLKEFVAFARKNHCYLVCPMYTRENNKIYNSAVVFDRQGTRMGEYRKIHPTQSEVERGIVPGPLQPPVFKTDFGVIGMQICFDIQWDEGWKALRQQGAEIVFWPSAYAGGQALNAMAWQNNYITVSSTNKGTSKICDISGEVVDKTGTWDPNFIYTSMNLEKVFLHVWPFVLRFDEIRAKYGRKVRIMNHHDEEWAVIESLSPDVRVKDIIKEFDLLPLKQYIHDSEIVQNKARG